MQRLPKVETAVAAAGRKEGGSGGQTEKLAQWQWGVEKKMLQGKTFQLKYKTKQCANVVMIELDNVFVHL